jgi:ribosomal protein S18 acetylase RimI-like enzyme
VSTWPIRPLRPDDVPCLSGLDFEITSSWALAVQKEVQGLAVTWRLQPQQLAEPFRSTGFAPTAEEWAELGRNLGAGLRDGFVVEAQGRPVAMIELGVEAWREVGVVWNLLIHRPHRGRGMGAALMRAAVSWARERDLRALTLETQTNNWTALNFYQRMGFKPCGLDDHFYTNRDLAAGEVALFWYRELGEEDGG